MNTKLFRNYLITSSSLHTTLHHKACLTGKPYKKAQTVRVSVLSNTVRGCAPCIIPDGYEEERYMEYERLMGDNSVVAHRRSFIQNLSYGMGHVHNDLCAAVWFSYTLFYLQIVLQLDSTTAGVLVMLGQFVDAMVTPGAGWVVDRIGTPQTWHLAGTVLVSFGISLMFSVGLNTNYWWSLMWYGGLITLFQIGWATVQISHLSIIPLISKDHNHSSNLTTIRYIASVCCGVTVYLITWVILKNNQLTKEIGPEDFYKFKKIVEIITFIGLIASLIFYCGIRWTNKHHYEDITESIPSGGTKSQDAYDVYKSPVVYQVSLLYVASRLYTILNLIYIPLYLEEMHVNLNQDGIREAVASIPLVSFLASFSMSIILKFRTNNFNDQVTYAMGSIFSVIGCLWIFLYKSDDSANFQIYGIAILIGMGSSATMISSLCLTADLVKTNGFRGGSVYSAVTFTDKLISGAIIVITQKLKCQPPDSCPHYYSNVLSFVCGSVAFLGLICLCVLRFKQ